MGKQIMFLQTLTDMKKFLDYCGELGINCYSKHGSNIEVFNVPQYSNQRLLSRDEIASLKEVKYLSRNVIEFSLPNFYSTKNQTDIISCGRLWVDSGAKEATLKDFEKLRKWIRKNYKHICDFWFADDILDKIVNNEVIAATNFGGMQIVNEELTVVLKDTWLKNRRYRDGEWVDSTDIRYYD